jgi:hypothetical protein
VNNVHEDEPVVFETRWALSYLRGPLTRTQIKQLMDPVRANVSTSAGIEAETSARPASAGGAGAPSSPRSSSSTPASARPVLPPEIPQYFIPIRSPQPAGATLLYQPGLIGSADVYFSDPKTKINAQQQRLLLARINDGPVPVEWASAEPLSVPESDLERQPTDGATFAALPAAASQPKKFESWSKGFADALYRIAKIELLRSPSMELTSRPDESEREFRVRLAQAAREERDAGVEKLRQKYAPKLGALQERLRKAQLAVEVQRQQSRSAKFQTAISFGATVLGALFGRKTLSTGNVGRATTAARGVGRSMKEATDVGRAQENVQAVQDQLQELDAQFKAEVAALTSNIDPTTEVLERIPLRPKKTDVKPRLVALAWAPYWRIPTGVESPAW